MTTRQGGGLYILRGRKALRVHDVLKWGRWFEDADRKVAYTEFLNVQPWIAIDKARIKKYIEQRRDLGLPMTTGTVDNIRMLGRMIVVSTVFIGLDHSYGSGPPLLFETMVFNGPCDGEQRRYPDWTSAEAGHGETVEAIRRALVTDHRVGSIGVSEPDNRS